jgi:hypothetical protein
VDTRRTKPEGPLDAVRDALGAAEPLATVKVLQSASPQTVIVEVTLPPLPRPDAPEEELAIRIDDVPVDAAMVSFAATGTSTIELPPGLAAVDVSALLSRSTGPQLRVPPGLRTTGPTPRVPGPTPRVLGPAAGLARPAGSPVDALLTGGPAPFGGHVPGTTGEVPRLDGIASRREGRTATRNGSPDPATALASGSTGTGAAGTTRGQRRDLKQATKDAARSLAALVVDGRSARRTG